MTIEPWPHINWTYWPSNYPNGNSAVQPDISYWITRCRWCGGVHNGEAYPKVESVEYHDNGAIKKVTFRNGDSEFYNMDDFLADLDEKTKKE